MQKTKHLKPMMTWRNQTHPPHLPSTISRQWKMAHQQLQLFQFDQKLLFAQKIYLQSSLA